MWLHRRPARLRALALLAALATGPALAGEEAEMIESHGLSTFGELKYRADFERFDYVNPGAPKGRAPNSYDR